MRSLLLVSVLAGLPVVALAQTAPVTTTPDDLRTPLAPAFALLDVTPTSVDRPQNSRALTLNLFSAFRESEGLPRNYALDVTPFWLRSHPTLTFDDYYTATPLQTIARTFSVSVATTSSEAADPALPAVTSLGLGVRTLVRQGRAHPSLQAARDDLMDVSFKQAELDDAIVKLEFEHDAAVTAGRTDEARKLKEAVADAQRTTQAQRDELSAQARAIALRIQELDKDRVGVMVSVAAAHVIDFPGERFQDAEAARWGLWITPAYRMLVCGLDAANDCEATLDAIAVVRFLADRRGTADDSTWDIGGRVLWQPTKGFALSAELVRRGGLDATGGEGSTRSVGVLEYRLRDDLVLFGSFGKNFDGEPRGRTLVSLLGLNVGFGRKPTIDVAAPE
jgi:hypothetical protein